MQNPCFTVHICWFDRIICGADDPAEFLILQTFSHDQRHVMGCGIMVRVRQSAGICKVCIRASDLCCTLVHHIYEVLLCAAYMFRDLSCNLIGRLDNKCIKACPHAHYFAHLHSDISGIPADVTGSCFREYHILLQRAILHCKK